MKLQIQTMLNVHFAKIVITIGIVNSNKGKFTVFFLLFFLFFSLFYFLWPDCFLRDPYNTRHLFSSVLFLSRWHTLVESFLTSFSMEAPLLHKTTCGVQKGHISMCKLCVVE